MAPHVSRAPLDQSCTYTTTPGVPTTYSTTKGSLPVFSAVTYGSPTTSVTTYGYPTTTSTVVFPGSPTFSITFYGSPTTTNYGTPTTTTTNYGTPTTTNYGSTTTTNYGTPTTSSTNYGSPTLTNYGIPTITFTIGGAPTFTGTFTNYGQPTTTATTPSTPTYVAYDVVAPGTPTTKSVVTPGKPAVTTSHCLTIVSLTVPAGPKSEKVGHKGYSVAVQSNDPAGVSFSSGSPAVCGVNSSTGAVTFHKPGTCVINVLDTATSGFTGSASGTVRITVKRAKAH